MNSETMTLAGCSFDGCPMPGYCKSLCKGHYSQQCRGVGLKPLRSYTVKVPKPCSFEGCGLDGLAKGLCQAHYDQQRRGRGELRELKRIAPLTVVNATERDRAYFAGLLDGEGSIFLADKGRRYWRLVIVNTDEAVLRWAERKFGGSTHPLKRPETGLGTKPIFEWRENRQQNVRTVLEAIVRDMRIKKALALEVLDELREREANMTIVGV